MSKIQKFYVCEKCGNMVELIHSGGGQLVCCGQPMLELVPGVVEAAVEKHIPDFKINGNTVEVQVGSVEHPMLDEHWIEWILITDGETSQRVDLNPGETPRATFEIDTTKPFTIYAFCNLHGLWKAEK